MLSRIFRLLLVCLITSTLWAANESLRRQMEGRSVQKQTQRRNESRGRGTKQITSSPLPPAQSTQS